MQTDRLFAGLATSPIPGIFPVRRIVHDSTVAESGDLFVCLCGSRADGHDFAYAAYANGCRLFLAARQLPLPENAVQILTADTQALYPILCARFFEESHKKLRLLAITGTKGKTSTLAFLSAILQKRSCGLICVLKSIKGNTREGRPET